MLVGLEYLNNVYYYLRNGQNDITGIIDSSGTQVVSYVYDSWGKLVSISGSMADTIGVKNPFRYRGYYYDTETGLYYLQSRYYDPVVGRFLNADVLDVTLASPGQPHWDKNLFAYCDNNPVLRTDDGGEFWHIVVGAVVGGVINGVMQVASNFVEMEMGSGGSWTDGLGMAVLSGAASGALAVTGFGVGAIIAGNAAISGVENVAGQLLDKTEGKKFSFGSLAIDVTMGAVSGAIGGKGKGSKSLTNVGKQSVKRTVNAVKHKGVQEGAKEAAKATSYYFKNSYNAFYSPFLKNLPLDCLQNASFHTISMGYRRSPWGR